MKKYLVCIERGIIKGRISAYSNTFETYMAVFANDKEDALRIVQEITARILTFNQIIEFPE